MFVMLFVNIYIILMVNAYTYWLWSCSHSCLIVIHALTHAHIYSQAQWLYSWLYSYDIDQNHDRTNNVLRQHMSRKEYYVQCTT